jgi:hypothetical protein
LQSKWTGGGDFAMMRTMSDTLDTWTSRYGNTADGNDEVFERFTALTDTIGFLKEHKDFVEANDWGMGFRAFLYQWLLILEDCHRRFGAVSALEIGVFRGQTLSLWGLIARQRGIELEISALSPFSGNQPKNRWVRSFKKRFSRQYKAQKKAGSLYYDDDFYQRTREIFEKFAGPFDAVHIYKGLSTDPDIQKAVAGNTFEIIYIDGDHSFDAVKSDIAGYAPLVRSGGYLVMDDAGHFLPAKKYDEEPFYKGYESVARACETIEGMGFRNVLNVGHNRVYRRD